MKTGIYSITNLIDNKVYVGFATDIERRWSKHKWGLKRNTHDNSHLQAAWNKYGSNNLKFEIIELCNVENLLDREHYYAILMKVHDRKLGYNIHPTGREGQILRSEETKQKLSKAHTGRKRSAEHIANMSKAKLGKKLSEETLRKIRLYNERKRLEWEGKRGYSL
jgi:group I intron endonuclease